MKTMAAVIAAVVALGACTPDWLPTLQTAQPIAQSGAQPAPQPAGDATTNANLLVAEPGTVAAAPVRLADSVRFAAPVHVVGDTWTYSDGYGLRVTEVRDDGTARLTRTDAPGRWMERRGIFRDSLMSPTAARRVVFRSEDPSSFYAAGLNEPVVYVREYLRDDVLVRHRTSWVKEGTERITVPAGTFDTIVFTMRTRSLTGTWTGYERWWYSPEVRNYVRLEFKYGDTPDSARVLLRYTVN